jgi:hypothetical protein
MNDFSGCSFLREVIIPEVSLITQIKGFSFCVLTLLNIPPSVTTIAFRGRAFLAYSEDLRLKLIRRRLHLCCH